MAAITNSDELGTGTGTGTGTGIPDGTGTGTGNVTSGRSGNHTPTDSGTGTGKTTEKDETSSETISLVEAPVKAKRGRPSGSTNSSASEKSSKTKTKKSDDSFLDIEGLFVTIIESMVVSRYGTPGQFTPKEREILDGSMTRLMERVGIVNKLKNSPALDVAMIAYVFVCVGFRVNAAKAVNSADDEDFSQEIKQRKQETRVPPITNIPMPDFTVMGNGNGRHT